MNKKYNKLDPHLHKVSSTMITLNNEERKKANNDLKQVLETHLIPAMKKADSNFNKLFRKVNYSGSFYENLKISSPNEFDLNLELRLPAKNVELSYDACAGFVQMRLEERLELAVLARWVDSNDFLLRTKVYSWIQGVVDKALREINVAFCDIVRSTSGPAVTLNCTCLLENGHSRFFSVDLVPVFVFGLDRWPCEPVRQPVVLGNPSAQEWCVVPKGPRNVNNPTLWRMSFYNQEKAILNDKATLKNVLKLFKLLRDCQGWHSLSSYYIKTIFLWENQSRGSAYWNQGLGFVFMEMLKVVSHYLRDKQSIPFFWNERHNLIDMVHRSEIEKMGRRIAVILKDIEKSLEDDNAECVTRYLKKKEDTRNGRASSETELPSEQSTGSQNADLGQSPTLWAGLAVGIGAIVATGAILLFRGNRRND